MADADAMEARLVFFGIQYTKAIVPDTDAAQLFFFDPGNVQDSDAVDASSFVKLDAHQATFLQANNTRPWSFHAEGHGVEVGCDYAKVAHMLKSKMGKGGAAVAP